VLSSGRAAPSRGGAGAISGQQCALQPVLWGSEPPRHFGRYRDVWIAHTRAEILGVVPQLVHSGSHGRPASGPRVLGGAEKPLLARHIRSSKRRRQDAYETPSRRRTHMRSRRLSLRLRGWLCSPARTPCCRSSSISTLTLAIGRLPQPRGERHSRGGGLATAWFVTFSQAELQGAGASEPGTRMPPAGASTDHGERRPRSPTRQWCWLWPGHPAAARTSPAIRSDSCARPTPCLVAPFSGSCR
jgi:hypothetical protein